MYLRSRTDLSARFRVSGEKIPKSEHKIKKKQTFSCFHLEGELQRPGSVHIRGLAFTCTQRTLGIHTPGVHEKYDLACDAYR